MRKLVRRSMLYAAVALAALGTLAQAQQVVVPDLAVSRDGGFGPQLVDGGGMTLYMFAQDTAKASACTGECTSNWPPLLVEGDPVLGEGIDPALVDVLERDDGTRQLAYAGRPLYTYVRDFAPGDTHGQALGDLFFVLSAAGERRTGYAEPVTVELDADLMAAYLSEGEADFGMHCAACHGSQGEGVIAPRLAGNANLGRTSFFVNRILNGYPDHGMPAFRDSLSDRQVAAVATFVRNAWGNELGAVAEDEVTDLR